MNFTIEPLSQKHAEEIANDWHYPGEYAFYDMKADPEDYQELMDPILRQENYFQVLYNQQLFGFFIVEPAKDEEVFWLGLGIKPEWTGQGIGRLFLVEILQFFRSHYQAVKLQLGVAAFNIRAQKVYESCGFVKVRSYQQATNGSQWPFVEMALRL